VALKFLGETEPDRLPALSDVEPFTASADSFGER